MAALFSLDIFQSSSEFKGPSLIDDRILKEFFQSSSEFKLSKEKLKITTVVFQSSSEFKLRKQIDDSHSIYFQSSSEFKVLSGLLLVFGHNTFNPLLSLSKKYYVNYISLWCIFQSSSEFKIP